MSPADTEHPAPSVEEADRVFVALAHEARRHVLLLLAQRGELPSGYLAARFQHSWPTTSRHLKVLEEAGLVEVRRQGRSSTYRLNRAHLKRVVNGWLQYLEPVGPEQRWCPSGPRSTTALAEQASPESPESEPGNRRRRDGPAK
ncbi:helix-turn-helix transcriptional regulator [Planosporangium thailandense]|uniref:Helix-turn-helix transcriptional regulator n=1 Tax=Planosporangium thailandense TaxID=765197 RepID=A0ABX0Y465_9ACTN|nr:helix-turn-helix transcriptional regulator [Planosporangium thailandense]